MKYLIALLGLAVVLGLAFLVSSNRKQVKLKPLAVMLALQLILGFVLLNTSFGYIVITAVAKVFEKLLEYAAIGINFVFGGLANEGAHVFFINVLLPIVFISALIGILQFTKVLPVIMRGIGFVLSKINGMGQLESYNAVASAAIGQSEVFITVKKQIDRLPANRLYTLCASAMSTVSMSIVGAYMTMVEPKYVVTAIVLNLFGGFIIASIINPYTVDPKEDILEIIEEKQTFFEMLGEYIMDGFKVAIIVGAMLIGYNALIGMVNDLFDMTLGISFQDLLGYIFSPIAFIMGVPWAEAVSAGSVMATKLITNEFVAMLSLPEYKGEFSERTLGIVSVFLISFANFSSIGIIAGAVKGLSDRQGSVAASFGLKLLYGATLVSILTSVIVSVLI